MKLSSKKVALVVVFAVSLLLLFADEYPALRFRGDGRFSGGPVFGYSIRLRPVPFYRPGQYVFHFHGMPDEEMILELRAEGRGSNDEAELRAKTVIEEVLTDKRGQIICQAAGPPLENGQNANGWVLMLAVDEAAYWHWNCAWTEFKPWESYTLTLRIREVDPRTPKINLIPILRSRGPDLP